MRHSELSPRFCKLAIAVTVSQMLATGWSQVIGPLPQNFKLDGLIGEWNQNAPSFSRDGPDERNPIWIARSSQGLVFGGSSVFFDGPAHDRRELSTKGRLELWLSLDDEIEMPPIGWYGDDQSYTKEDCASYDVASQKQECLEWIRQQSTYREKLKSLFTRMWRITPNVVEEAYATGIYASLPDAQQKALAQLKPSGQPVAKFSFDQFGQKFTFEVLVPWEAFPPGHRLTLERIKLALNMMEGNHTRATTQSSPDQIPGNGLRSFAFATPIVAHFTPCDFPLIGLSGEPLYCFWGPSLTVRDGFTLHNELACCGAISMAPPNALSPFVVPFESFVQKLSADEFLCGPSLAYRKGKSIILSSLELGAGPGFFPLAPLPPSLPVFRLPNGTRLIREGPSLSYQQQSYTMCSACPFVKLAIYALKPSGEIEVALSLGDRIGDIGLSEYDVEMSADWRTVTEFRNNGEKWTSKKFCLRGEKYQPCGEDSNAAAPKHGLVPRVPD